MNDDQPIPYVPTEPDTERTDVMVSASELLREEISADLACLDDLEDLALVHALARRLASTARVVPQ